MASLLHTAVRRLTKHNSKLIKTSQNDVLVIVRL